ncbi:MAG: AAA family ATPase [Phycisphaerae bacterium]|nr:AAA family ATPase [Phycisphaerae bacterium]
MWVESIVLKNFRSFQEASLEFSQGMNVLIGTNNSGKSSIILPLQSLQQELLVTNASDLRIGEATGSVDIIFGGSTEAFFPKTYDRTWFEFVRGKGSHAWGGFNKNTQQEPLHKLPSSEPGNFIYPFLSNRKVTDFSDQISETTVNSVLPTFLNLYAKVDQLANPAFQPAYELYKRACNDILGFSITAAVKGNGKRAVYVVQNMDNIPLKSMGADVSNILGLVVNLAKAKNKLFLIEEPENDIHPQALKSLLDLVIEKSKTNQFIITTHSNIVLRKLVAVEGSKVFKVSCTIQTEDRLPLSEVKPVPATPEDRREILSELGYELCDVDMWDGWLILEESSAECIIREYLIPWFAEKLKHRLQTCAASGVENAKTRFELFIFLHLEPTYKGKAWVVVDGGDKEKEVIDELKADYHNWPSEHFRQFSKHDFEEYYPEQFRKEIGHIQALSEKQERRDAKKKLLKKIVTWIDSDPETAQAAFKKSAAEVITILQEIEAKLTENNSQSVPKSLLESDTKFVSDSPKPLVKD